LEVFKYILSLPFETHRQATIDLAVNTFVCEPLDGPKMRVDFKEKVEDELKSTEFKKEYKLVQWRSYPEKKGFSVWDKTVVNKGDITFAGLIKELETLYPGVIVEAIFKRNISKKEVESGLGQNLWSLANPFSNGFKMATAGMAKTTNAALKASMQRDIDNYNNYEKKREESVAKRYLSVYGALITADRNYIMLEGNYSNKAGDRVMLPPILLVFKAGSWHEDTAAAASPKK